MSELHDFNQRVIREFRANQGKVGGQLAHMPVLLLTMTGARSGRTITKPLVYTTDGDRLVVIASFAGAPKHPIYMKLSVDSLDQSSGFILFCQTLSEYLGRSVSFA